MSWISRLTERIKGSKVNSVDMTPIPPPPPEQVSQPPVVPREVAAATAAREIRQVMDKQVAPRTNDNGRRGLPAKLDNIKVRRVRGKDGLRVKLKGDLRDQSHPIVIEQAGAANEHDVVDQSSKLTEEQRLRVCELIAQFRSEGEVQIFCKKEWGVTISRQAIWCYLQSKKWRLIIDKFRQEYVSQVMDIPITHKKVRLQRLEEIFQRNESDTNVTAYNKRIQSIAILAAAMKEVDEKASNFTTIYAQQIISLTDDDLIKRKAALIKQVEAIDITPKELKAAGALDTVNLPVQLEQDNLDQSKEVING